MGKDFRDPKLRGKENHKRKSNAHNPVQYLWITSAISICFSEMQKTLTPKITKVGIFSFFTLSSNSEYPRISQNSVKYFWLSLSHPLKASGYISVLFPIITTSVRFSQSLNASRPISFTEAGIIIACRFLLPRKASGWIYLIRS